MRSGRAAVADRRRVWVTTARQIVAAARGRGLDDAAAAGRAVFFWDHAGLDVAKSEIPLHGGAVVCETLEHLCAALERFNSDVKFRESLEDCAARFPVHLRQAQELFDAGDGTPAGLIAALALGKRSLWVSR